MTTPEEFRKFGKEMIDYVADYLENIRDKPVLPTVKPGYIKDLIPAEAPENPESWQDVMKDVDRVIMPGVTHWHHPQFHAYFATANSYPSIVADILSDAIGCIGFSWIASPACTELEMVMMNWMGKMLALPEDFLFRPGGQGGGVIQGTASEASLVAVLSARARTVTKLEAEGVENAITKLICYGSKLAHSSVERAGMLAGVKTRALDVDEDLSVRADILEAAIKEDRAKGLIPFCFVATLGTTSCCSYDNLPEVGPICQREGIWLHVDAAYAGSAFVCPEYRPILNGIENADSFNFNPHKWLLINFDCSCMWVKNANELVDAFNVDPLYLKHEYQGQIPDYRHWHIPLGRRFRSLKMWFVMRLYGQEGLRSHIREQIALAHEFEEKIENDGRFEISMPVTMGLVCFRLKGSNEINEVLNKRINDVAKIHVTPSKVGDLYILRLAICSRFTRSEDMEFAYKNICDLAEEVLSEQK